MRIGMNWFVRVGLGLCLAWILGGNAVADEAFERDRIQPYAENPYYWQYKGEPLLLVGGTHDDNPFNNPTHDPVAGEERIEQHLDLFAAAGGNYVRNTMSHRDIMNVYPYMRTPDLIYDALDDPDAWSSRNGDHALHAERSLNGAGALSIWREDDSEGPLALRREFPETDLTNGTIEVWFWVENETIAGDLDRLEIQLDSFGGSAVRTWPGEIMSGWHFLVLHVDDFGGDGFDPTSVDAVELVARTEEGAPADEGDVLWDDFAVRGRFDLTRFNPEYWSRFESFLDAALERDLIVQVELWDKVELFDDGSGSAVKWDPRRGWSKHPFNPRNNVNYTAESSGLKEVIDWSYHPRGEPSGDRDIETVHPFWYTAPSVAELLPGGSREISSFELTAAEHAKLVETVLPHQQAFVEKILEIALDYPNVLYTINNETHLPTSDWSDYWAEYIRERARDEGRGVEVGDMRGESEIERAPSHAHEHIIRTPDLYSFIDVSQNNGRRTGDEQWLGLQWARSELADIPDGVRPINNTKIYDFRPSGEEANGLHFSIQKYWRNILGGAASSRFHRRMGAALHRPYDGDGSPIDDESNEPGLANFRSAAMFVEAMDVFAAEPDNGLLRDRDSGEAYALAIPGRQYAVYFPAGGAVGVEVEPGRYEVRWLDIMSSEWREASVEESSGVISLSPPTEPHALVVLARILD